MADILQEDLTPFSTGVVQSASWASHLVKCFYPGGFACAQTHTCKGTDVESSHDHSNQPPLLGSYSFCQGNWDVTGFNKPCHWVYVYPPSTEFRTWLECHQPSKGLSLFFPVRSAVLSRLLWESGWCDIACIFQNEFSHNITHSILT